MDITFAFVDLAGYTALTEAHGDEAAADSAERFYAIAEESLAPGVRIVKRIGDAVMLAGMDPFASVASVLATFARVNIDQDLPELRAGLETGSAVERDGDYFGATVNLAARISAHARSGEVLCGEALAACLTKDKRVRVVSAGAVALRNVSKLTPIFSILLNTPSATGAVDPVCRMKVDHPRATVEHAGSTYVFCSDACADRFRASPEAYARKK